MSPARWNRMDVIHVGSLEVVASRRAYFRFRLGAWLGRVATAHRSADAVWKDI